MAKGQINIQIQKFNFSPGDTIEGKVILKLNEPIKARGVNIRLLGEKFSKTYSTNPQTQMQTPRSTNTILFDFTQPLDTEKEYPPGSELTYSFQIKIPTNVFVEPKFGEGVVGTLLKAGEMLSGQNSRIEWSLTANLDIPWAIDISKKVQINVA